MLSYDESRGKELRRVREKAHLSVEELATCIGRSPGVVCAIEAGRIRASYRYVTRLCEICRRPELWMPSTLPPPDGQKRD